jgi:hypothetical protein
MRRSVGFAFAFTALTACAARTPPAAVGTPKGNLRALGVKAAADPTVNGSRAIPEAIDEDKSLGEEPGGGARLIIAGMRIVSLPGGAILTSPDRLPAAPSQTIPLPSRAGGGFLFQIGATLWRSERWLGGVTPVYVSPTTIARIVVGLDRVYVRGSSGTYVAFDAKSGATLDLGAIPPSPFIGAYAATDGWRAVAISDFRGAVATLDAGATWRPLGLPIDAREVQTIGSSIVVSGTDVNRQQQWYEVRGDGQVTRLASAPVRGTADKPVAIPMDAASRAFGKRPLAAAIEDGWPLADGTAVVARDGAIARVRLSDGALVEASADAYPMRPSRCHPMSLARAKDPTAFGFVCGESRGKTIVYRYAPESGRMIELRRFDKPRAVVPSGNGALAVRGACAGEAAPDDADRSQQSYCLFARDDQWREIRVRGDVGGERVVVLADGRVAVVSPPHGDVTTARLTTLDHGKATTVAIAFPPISPDVARALKYGVWLDGIEERRPGVLGVWLEAAGALLGMEITLDGKAKLGKLVREGGAPIVSGRYGLGWTSTRRGYETTDGGMTWTDVELPEPIASAKTIASRACGPVGCNAAGWLRVGWGPPTNGTRAETPPPARLRATPLSPKMLELECEAAAGAPPEPPKPPSKKPKQAATTQATPGVITIGSHGPYGGYPGGYYGGYYDTRGLDEMPAFYTQAGPVLKTDELGISIDVQEPADHASRTGSVARVYAWGHKTAEWEHSGRWSVKWVWPYGGWPETRSTSIAASTYANLEDARQKLGSTQWSFALGDDASHALLLGRRHNGTTQETLVFALEENRPPIEVRRADGEPLGEIESAVRVAGRWFVTVPSVQYPVYELPSTAVWVVDGSQAREVARVPRAGYESRPATRLARRSDGRALGLVVDGQPPPDRTVAQRWVLPIDVESATIGEPELLGAADLADRTVTLCASGEGPGWVLDALLGTTARVYLSKTTVTLSQPLVRLHLTRDAACVEHLAASLDYYGARATESLVRSAKDGAPAHADGMGVAVFASSQRARYPIRCVKK